MPKVPTVTLPRALLLELLAKAARGARSLEIRDPETGDELFAVLMRVSYYTAGEGKYRYKENVTRTYTHRCRDCGEQYDNQRPHSRVCPSCISTKRKISASKGAQKRATNALVRTGYIRSKVV